MKRGYEFVELTDSEKERLIEIKFYVVIRALAQHIKDSYNMFEYIDTLARLAKCNLTIIKGCISAISDGRRTLTVPNKTELVVMLYRANYTIAEIKRLTGMHVNTVRNHLDTHAKDPYQYPMRFSTIQRMEIIKFLELYQGLHIKI